jgi:hypothetical protein
MHNLHPGQLSHSISLKSSNFLNINIHQINYISIGRPYGGAIVAQARRNGGFDGSSRNKDFFDYFSRKK